MDKFLRLLLYSTLFTPLLVFRSLFFPFITSKMLVLEGLILIATLIWLYLWSKNPERYAPKITWLTIALGGYIGIQFIAALQGANFWRSFYSTFERMEGVFIWVILFLFFIVLGALYKKKADWLWLFRISLAISIFIALKAVNFFSLFQGNIIFPTSISGVFGSPIYLGVYTLFHTGIALILLRSLDRDLKNFKDFFPMVKSFWAVFYTIGLVVNILILFSSFARGVMAGFFLGALVCIAWYFLWGPNRRFFLKTAGFLFLVFVLTFPLWGSSSLAKRMYSVSLGLRADETRVINWKVAFDAFLARPLVGWGSNSYFVAQNKFYNPRLPGLINQAFDRVHNKYLEIAVDAGILGLVSYASIFLFISLSLWRARKKEPFLSALLAGLFVAYLVQNITAFDNPGSYLPLFLLFAFINSEFFEPLRFQLKPKPALVAGSWMLVAALAWQAVWQPYRANVVLANTLVKQQAKEKDLQGILEGYKKALSYQSMGDYEIRLQLGTFVINQLELTKELLEFAIQEAEKELKFSKQEVLLHIVLAKLYEKKGAAENNKEFFAKAEKLLQDAINLSPSRPESYEHYIVFLINQARGSDVRTQLAKIEKLNETIFESKKNQWYLGVSYYIENNFEKAYAQFQKLIERGESFGSAQELLVLARTTSELKKYKEMVRWYEDLYHTNDRNPEYNIYLAAAYKQVGDLVHAEEYARRAAKLDPKLADQAEVFIKSLHP